MTESINNLTTFLFIQDNFDSGVYFIEEELKKYDAEVDKLKFLSKLYYNIRVQYEACNLEVNAALDNFQKYMNDREKCKEYVKGFTMHSADLSKYTMAMSMVSYVTSKVL